MTRRISYPQFSRPTLGTSGTVTSPTLAGTHEKKRKIEKPAAKTSETKKEVKVKSALGPSSVVVGATTSGGRRPFKSDWVNHRHAFTCDYSTKEPDPRF